MSAYLAMSSSTNRGAFLLKASCLSLLIVGVLSACDRSTVPPAPKPKTEMSGAASVDPQVSGDQAKGTPGASDRVGKADPKGDLTKQDESTAMPVPGQANDHSNVALDPKSNTKN